MKTLFSAVVILITVALILMILNKKGLTSGLMPSVRSPRFTKKTSVMNSGSETRLSLHWFVKVTNLETGKSLVRRLYTLNPDGIYTIGRSDEDDSERKPDLDFNGTLSLRNDPDDDSYLTVSRDQAIIYEDGKGRYILENRSRMNCCENAETHKPVSFTELKEGLSILIGDCYTLTFSRSSSFPEKEIKNSRNNNPAVTKIYSPVKTR